MKSGDITGVTGVPELTWCYNRNTPHDRVVPNFGVTEFTEFTMVFWGTLEETEKMERLEVRTMGALWSIYKLILSYMICLYMYPWE